MSTKKIEILVRQLFKQGGRRDSEAEVEKYCNKFRGQEKVLFESLMDEFGEKLVAPYLEQWEAEQVATSEGFYHDSKT